jgi:hypothetical protein
MGIRSYRASSKTGVKVVNRKSVRVDVVVIFGLTKVVDSVEVRSITQPRGDLPKDGLCGLGGFEIIGS